MTAEHATRFQFDLRAAGVYISEWCVQCARSPIRLRLPSIYSEPEEAANDHVPVAAPIGDQVCSASF